MKRVVVGMSGGVDSSVAAYLLKEQGYDVIGLFMKNWHDDSVTISDECPWLEDSNDALIVSEKLGIPFQTIDLSKEYKERIVDYMFQEYEKGRTPNPDVLCNREIKFDIFLKIALDLGADYVATGHYCQKGIIQNNNSEIYQLLAGKDNNKDQSYFLCQLNQEQLSKALFPIGNLTKPEVREIAKKQNLITADKKDSQGLCFIGKVKLPTFLQQKLESKKGSVIEISKDSSLFLNNPALKQFKYSLENLKEMTAPFIYKKLDGENIGNHNGAHYYTIGQRKGLNIGGKTDPLFVIDTDVNENIVYTGQGSNHPGLFRKGLFIKNDEIHWIRNDLKLSIGEHKSYNVRYRYRQNLEQATLYQEQDGLYIIFENVQSSITRGQFAVWYENEELIGSGVIFE